jgi:hypothetical protein
MLGLNVLRDTRLSRAVHTIASADPIWLSQLVSHLSLYVYKNRGARRSSIIRYLYSTFPYNKYNITINQIAAFPPHSW